MGSFLQINRHNLFLAISVLIITFASIPIFTYAYFADDLTSKEGIMNQNDTGVTLTDSKDRPFFTFYQGKYKKFVPLSEIPKFTQQAVIAMEDKDFYKHAGFSLKAMARSLMQDLKEKDTLYGGSTITQQLVKNSLLKPTKSFLRKYQEIILAQEIERRYTKAQILEMYLNSVYFGEGTFGIQAASQVYFGKDVKDLTLAESAFLAGLLTSPSKLSPFTGHIDQAMVRQKIVLQKMADEGYISEDVKKRAQEEKFEFNDKGDGLNYQAPHFALMVKDELIKKFGEEQIIRSGFEVKTTLNLDWQNFAEKVVKEQVDKLKVNQVSNGAAVVMDPKTGEIEALVGSKDWYDAQFGKFNVAIAPRPPGSAFKPIVYSRAFEKRLVTPITILHDVPTTFANFDDKIFDSYPTRAEALQALSRDPNAYYRPVDFDRKFRGPVTVRRALANSLNIPSVELMKKVGVTDVLDFAKKLGITTLSDPSDYGLSLVLGAGEVKLLDLTSVYAMFANQGMRNEPIDILEIRDKFDNVVYKYQPSPQKVLEPEVAFLISSILSDNGARAEEFGNALTISRPAAVKTGTTEDFKDAWTLGYTPSLAIGVWVGNNDNTLMDQIAGSLGAAPIWRLLMEKFLTQTSVEKFEVPPNIVAVAGCVTNINPNEATKSALVKEYFISGTEPKPCMFTSPSSQPALSPGPQPVSIPQINFSVRERRHRRVKED